MNYKEVSQEILEAIGGKKMWQLQHTVRLWLRLALHDEDKVDQAKLDEMDAVKGTYSTGGQYQIIIGAELLMKYTKSFQS